MTSSSTSKFAKISAAGATAAPSKLPSTSEHQSQGSSGSRKTLDLEPNPFEQSFAQTKDGHADTAGSNGADEGSKGVEVTGAGAGAGGEVGIDEASRINGGSQSNANGAALATSKTATVTSVPSSLAAIALPQSFMHQQPQVKSDAQAQPPQQLSPPVLTPGGTRRLHTSSMLPPLVGMMSPGGGSLPGTPGLWSAFFSGGGGSGTPGSATAQYFNINPLNGASDPQQQQKQQQQQQQQTSAQAQQGQQYFNFVSDSRKAGLTPNESSMRTGITSGGGMLSAHLPGSNGFNLMMGTMPSDPISGIPSTPGGSLASFTLQGSATGEGNRGTGVTGLSQPLNLPNLKLPDSITTHKSKVNSKKIWDVKSLGVAADSSGAFKGKHSLKNSDKELSNKKRKLSVKKEASATSSPPPPPDNYESGNGRKRKSRGEMTEEEKRQNFLERNRLAASKCRQRKKRMVENMKEELDFYTKQYQSLNSQVSILREHVLTLRTILYAHKACPQLVEQVGGIETLNTLLNGTNYVAQLPQAHQAPPPTQSPLTTQEISSLQSLP
ncbi:hypothetical protein FOA43_000503 [Brettanomyces nanus]|uniref:BZIP domain-containing protein n=1 Tax=Eeniella nana TaxID=13502 RepID=A0A875RWG2_EENNA|nr:uncharacterized protein FOA43_000503 [Brettanomyces nanus]QPG73196.1 hypothetical protein FOA43_000503 [Brettanomyces nanus]